MEEAFTRMIEARCTKIAWNYENTKQIAKWNPSEMLHRAAGTKRNAET
jgi:hypothetical protein